MDNALNTHSGKAVTSPTNVVSILTNLSPQQRVVFLQRTNQIQQLKQRQALLTQENHRDKHGVKLTPTEMVRWCTLMAYFRKLMNKISY